MFICPQRCLHTSSSRPAPVCSGKEGAIHYHFHTLHLLPTNSITITSRLILHTHCISSFSHRHPHHHQLHCLLNTPPFLHYVMPSQFIDSFSPMEASIDSPTVTKDEPLDFDDFGSLGMLMTGPITPASTAPSDLYIGTPCGDSPTPSYSESPGNSLSPTPGPGEAPKDGEKKPVKKRKSWGQVLPTPTTNLPPRYV